MISGWRVTKYQENENISCFSVKLRKKTDGFSWIQVENVLLKRGEKSIFYVKGWKSLMVIWTKLSTVKQFESNDATSFGCFTSPELWMLIVRNVKIMKILIRRSLIYSKILLNIRHRFLICWIKCIVTFFDVTNILNY